MKSLIALGAKEPHLDVFEACELAHRRGLRKAEVVGRQHSARHAAIAQLLEDGQERLKPAQRDEGHADVEARAASELVLNDGEDLDPSVRVVDDECRAHVRFRRVRLLREEGRTKLRFKEGVRSLAGRSAGFKGIRFIHARILAAAAAKAEPARRLRLRRR